MAKQWALSGNAENVDWSDIAESGRAYADNLIGEPVISKVMHMMADEIERLRGYRDEAESQAAIASLAVARLRLTDEERDAVEFFAELPWAKESGNAAEAATLRGLLDRTATPHATSAQDSTPDGCTVQNDGSECKRRADYGKWLRTPYCEGHGCQCGGGGE